MNRTALKAISEAPPLSPPGQGQSDGAIPTQPRPATCAEDGCDAPATRKVSVPVSTSKGNDLGYIPTDYCAECAQLPGLEIIE